QPAVLEAAAVGYRPDQGGEGGKRKLENDVHPVEGAVAAAVEPGGDLTRYAEEVATEPGNHDVPQLLDRLGQPVGARNDPDGKGKGERHPIGERKAEGDAVYQGPGYFRRGGRR